MDEVLLRNIENFVKTGKVRDIRDDVILDLVAAARRGLTEPPAALSREQLKQIIERQAAETNKLMALLRPFTYDWVGQDKPASVYRALLNQVVGILYRVDEEKA